MTSPLLRVKRQVDSNYGWFVAGFGVVILLAAGDTPVRIFTAMLHEEPLGTPRSTLVWTISAAGQASTLLLPLAGLAVDRFGPRRMSLAGMTLCGAACIAAAVLPRGLAQLTLYPVLSVGVLVGTNTPVMAAINRWFHDRRTIAIATTLFAVFAVELLLSKTVALPAVGAMILALGALALFPGLPAAAMLRSPATHHQRDVSGHEATDSRRHEWNDGETTVDYGWKEAVKTREFWLLVVGAASVSSVDQLARTLIFSIADGRFHVAGSWRTFEDLHEIVALPFILAGGIISMKIGLRAALMACAALHLVALVIILITNGMGWLYAGILLMAAGHGGGVALTVSAVGAYFGRRRFATILGTRSLVGGALQGGVLGLLFAFPSLLLYFGISVGTVWTLGAALIPAIGGVIAYWLLRDPRPEPPQMPTPIDD